MVVDFEAKSQGVILAWVPKFFFLFLSTFQVILSRLFFRAFWLKLILKKTPKLILKVAKLILKIVKLISINLKTHFCGIFCQCQPIFDLICTSESTKNAYIFVNTALNNKKFIFNSFHYHKNSLQKAATHFKNGETHFKNAETHFFGILRKWPLLDFAQTKSLHLIQFNLLFFSN